MGNEKENKHGQCHVCRIGDKILLKNDWKIKFDENTCISPCIVSKVRNNGKIQAYKENNIDVYNFCYIAAFQGLFTSIMG